MIRLLDVWKLSLTAVTLVIAVATFLTALALFLFIIINQYDGQIFNANIWVLGVRKSCYNGYFE
jgi:hypothetical protein